MTEPAKGGDGEAVSLQLKWRQTWPDREADYVANAEGYGRQVGRIYRYEAGPQGGRWAWSLTAHGPEIKRSGLKNNGTEDSPRAAARMVEDAWFAAIKDSSLDQPGPKRNAYAMAKGGE